MAGSVYSALGKLDNAAAAYRRALALAPEDADLHLVLGRVMCELGHFEEYREAAETAVRLCEAAHDSVGLQQAWWELGWAYYKLKRWNESAVASGKAIELDPMAAPPRFNQGLALLRQGDTKGASAAYRAAMALGDAAALKRDGIDDLSDAMEESPLLPGAAAILGELQAHATKNAVEGRIRSHRR